MLTRGDVEQNTRPLGDSIWPRWDGICYDYVTSSDRPGPIKIANIATAPALPGARRKAA
jgi:hypothetical protein